MGCSIYLQANRGKRTLVLSMLTASLPSMIWIAAANPPSAINICRCRSCHGPYLSNAFNVIAPSVAFLTIIRLQEYQRQASLLGHLHGVSHLDSRR